MKREKLLLKIASARFLNLNNLLQPVKFKDNQKNEKYIVDYLVLKAEFINMY